MIFAWIQLLHLRVKWINRNFVAISNPGVVVCTTAFAATSKNFPENVELLSLKLKWRRYELANCFVTL